MDKIAKPAVIETPNGWAMARDDEGICAVSSPAGDYIELRGNSFTMRIFRDLIEGLLHPSSGLHSPHPAEQTGGYGVTVEMFRAALSAFRVPDELARSGRRVGRTAAALNLALEAAMAIAPRQALPDGWQLVPIDPTEEMIRKAWGSDTSTSDGNVKRVYAAMLAAAPSAGRMGVDRG